MTLERLKADMIAALKNKDSFRKDTLSNMVDAVQKAAISNKGGRAELTEDLVDATLIKYQKMVQEQVDTCPDSRADLKEGYIKELAIVKEYAPQLLTDENTIRDKVVSICATTGIEFDKKNRGLIMKTISPEMKKCADMKIVNKVVEELLQ